MENESLERPCRCVVVLQVVSAVRENPRHWPSHWLQQRAYHTALHIQQEYRCLATCRSYFIVFKQYNLVHGLVGHTRSR